MTANREEAPRQPVTEELPQIEKEEQEITAEVPEYEPYVVTPAEPSPAVSMERPAPPPRAVYQTPLFVAPASEVPAESLIDDVDAAFIAAGLPSGPEYSASDEALRAAASLEAIARKLRTGKIELHSPSESALASDEALLTAVLAALLASR